jgi:hypothetical protein
MSATGGINEQLDDVVAAVVSSAATPPVINKKLGVNAQTDTPAGVVRNGKGDFTVNFPLSQCDPAARIDKAGSAGGAAIVSIDLAAATDSSSHVLVFDAAGAAVDLDFWFEARRIRVP